MELYRGKALLWWSAKGKENTVPTGLRRCRDGGAYPTLKRGANQQCASGAGLHRLQKDPVRRETGVSTPA